MSDELPELWDKKKFYEYQSVQFSTHHWTPIADTGYEGKLFLSDHIGQVRIRRSSEAMDKAIWEDDGGS